MLLLILHSVFGLRKDPVCLEYGLRSRNAKTVGVWIRQRNKFTKDRLHNSRGTYKDRRGQTSEILGKKSNKFGEN